jgi:hypothetical protein
MMALRNTDKVAQVVARSHGFFEGNSVFFGRTDSVPTTILAATTIIGFEGMKG